MAKFKFGDKARHKSSNDSPVMFVTKAEGSNVETRFFNGATGGFPTGNFNFQELDNVGTFLMTGDIPTDLDGKAFVNSAGMPLDTRGLVGAPRNPEKENRDYQSVFKWLLIIQTSLSFFKDQKASMIAQIITQNFIRDWPQIADIVYGGARDQMFATVTPLAGEGIDLTKIDPGTLMLIYQIIMEIISLFKDGKTPGVFTILGLVKRIISIIVGMKEGEAK